MIERAADFLPAADEVWRLQRGTDLECQIFQEMADSGHYQGEGGTRQGIYVLSPGGRLLASDNVLNPTDALILMERGLKGWKALPQSERELDPRAASSKIRRWEDSYPADGLVLRATLRDLPSNGDGPGAERQPPANRDHAWFSKSEALQFLPSRQEPGQTAEVPRKLLERLACLHFVDAVYGQGLPFAPAELAAGELTSEIRTVESGVLTVELQGHVRLEARGPWMLGQNDWTPNAEYPRSIDLDVVGTARFDDTLQSFTEFDLIATGVRSGRTQFNGRSGADDEGAIGFVFERELPGPSSKVPPAFIDLYRAFGADWVKSL